jgi:hypothetical protein
MRIVSGPEIMFVLNVSKVSSLIQTKSVNKTTHTARRLTIQMETALHATKVIS